MSTDKVDMFIEVCEGKYTFITYHEDWRIHVLRYGERWLVLEDGHKAINALMSTVESLLKGQADSRQRDQPLEQASKVSE